MKRLLLTLTLSCALFTSAFAGEIPSVGAPAPVVPPKTTAPGEIPSVGSTAVSDAALSAVLAVLGLL